MTDWMHLLDTCRSIYAVGRNYAEHATELGNQVPDRPLWFMKSVAGLSHEGKVTFPSHLGPIHYEAEWLVRVGRNLALGSNAQYSDISHCGLALDFTARELQGTLKKLQHPWDRSKSFANSCWIAGLVDAAIAKDGFRYMLHVNGDLKQKGASELMVFPVLALMDDLLTFISLQTGDLVLTGTPKGVGPVSQGDVLRLSSPTLGLIRELTIG